MTRAAQIRKKLAFDPSELNDLIFSPAVGNGTASHLLLSPSSLATTVAAPHASTVVHQNGPIADEPQSLVVDTQPGLASLPEGSSINKPTVDTDIASTVDRWHGPTVDCQKHSPTVALQAGLAPLSHESFLNGPTVDRIFGTTVGQRLGTTVGHQDQESNGLGNATTVDPLLVDTFAEHIPVRYKRDNMSIGDTWPATTVIQEDSELQRENNQARADFFNATAVDKQRPLRPYSPEPSRPTPHLGPTVDPQAVGEYWFTKEGQPVKARQVRKIRRAQDAINSYEESVYKALWESRVVQQDPKDPDCKIVQAGYDHLCKQTRLAKKSIQRLMARLLEKDFIAIERPADIWTRTPTVYRVRTFKQVLRIHTEKGREYAAKIGIGMAYVYRNTVDVRHRTTVDPMRESTVVRQAPVTVDATPLSTVVPETTNIRKATEQQRITPTPTDLAERIEQLIPGIDQGAIDRIWREGRVAVHDATRDEILFFLEERARILFRNRRLENPTGLLLSSIRDWLTERRVYARRTQQQDDAEELKRITAEIEENLRRSRK